MTAQFHENLILEGEKTSMAYCPYFPEDHPRIIRLTTDQVTEGIKQGTIFQYVFSTACWRQYVGTWEIKDGLFYLNELSGIYKLTGEDPLFADWFSSVIRIPQGKMLHYVHMGFGSVYESELHIKILQGRVVTSRTVDNTDKDINHWDLGMRNLPGSENRFDGEDDLNIL